jgi:hypothetical protein
VRFWLVKRWLSVSGAKVTYWRNEAYASDVAFLQKAFSSPLFPDFNRSAA